MPATQTMERLLHDQDDHVYGFADAGADFGFPGSTFISLIQASFTFIVVRANRS